MKNFFLVLIVLATISIKCFSQDGMHLAINAGLATGDSDELFTFNASANLGFLWGISDDVAAGITAGYSLFIGEDITGSIRGNSDNNDWSFIPIAGSARFNISDKFRLGVDIGYAVGISPDGNDGGFYYAPRVHYGLSDSLDLVLAYRGISVDGGSIDALTLGIEFGI